VRGKLERSDLLELALLDRAVEAALPFAQLLELAGAWPAVDDRHFEQDRADADRLARCTEAEFLDLCWQQLMDGPFPELSRPLPPFDRADRLLELPGTAGLLTRATIQGQPHLDWAANFVVVVRDSTEALLAGLVALETGHSATRHLKESGAVVIGPEPTPAVVRGRRFDAVLGLASRTDRALAEELLGPGGRLCLL
jgi:hypothetical protein